MELRQIDGIDTYGFPEDLRGHPLLAWMGDDYVRYVAAEILARFRKQDAGTEMLAIKCEELPAITSRVNEESGSVCRVRVQFRLQVLLTDSHQDCRRLRGSGEFVASGLDRAGETSVAVGFEIESTEAAGGGE